MLVLSPSVFGALVSLSLAMLMSSLGISIAMVALPTLAPAFGASFQATQWVVLAYLLAITTLIVSAGRLADLVGHRRLLLFGICIFTVTSMLCGLAPALWLLILARGAQGVGAAVMMAVTMALITEIVPRAKIGSAMGLLAMTSSVGTALGPTIGGVLIAGFSWRAIFLINVPMGITALLLAHRFLPHDRLSVKNHGTTFDYLGTILLVLILAAYALAMTIGRGSFGPLNFCLLLGAAVGTCLFVIAESKAGLPLIRLSMFRDPVLSASLATNGLVSTVIMTTLVVGPFYLSHALQLDAASVGMVMSIGPIVSAVTGIPAGRLTDRIGTAGITVIGLVGMAAGTLILALLPTKYGLIGYILPTAIVTSSYSLFLTANNTAVMSGVVPESRGLT